MSKRLLIGWELGAGNGHIQRILPLAKAFLATGWRVTAAMRDVRRSQEQCSSILNHPRFSLIQAPIFRHAKKAPTADGSLAAALANMGFAETEILAPVVAAWRSILKSFNPTAIISDIAPSLNIASERTVPLIVIGNGWTLPPHGILEHDLFRGSSEATLGANERVVKAARAVAPGFSADHLSDVLRGTENFVCVPSELDPYSRTRGNELYWPLEIPGIQRSEGRYPRSGIIYLPENHPARAVVCKAAARSGITFKAYLSGAESIEPEIQVKNSPIDFTAELPNASLVVHHGGLGTASWCLLNGVPQLLCPGDTEKYLIARAVIAHEAGGGFPATVNEIDLVDGILKAAQITPPPPDFSKISTNSGDETIASILHAAGEYCPKYPEHEEHIDVWYSNNSR